MTTLDSKDLTPEVRQAVEELAAGFSSADICADADGEGGAYVVVDCVPLNDIYKQRETWVGFRITYQYPFADVYPHFVRSDLRRVDGSALGSGTSTSEFRGRSAIQLSRSSNHRNPTRDTALLKLHKVLRWLNDRP